MASRSRTTFKKRQKELARMEKQRDKAAKRVQRKLEKNSPDGLDSPDGIDAVDGLEATDGTEPIDAPEAQEAAFSATPPASGTA